MKVFYSVLFALVGLICLAAAVLDWKWFIDHRPVRSRNGKRFAVGVAGVLLILFGVAVLFEWL